MPLSESDARARRSAARPWERADRRERIEGDGEAPLAVVQWFGSEALELTDQDPTGKVANEYAESRGSPRCSTFAAMLEALGAGPALRPGQVWYVAGQRTLMGTGL